MKKRIISTIIALCLLCTMLPTAVFAAEVNSGTCGENVTWVLNDAGTLTISGTGAMYDYNLEDELRPWNDYLNDVTAVVIEDGITYIGNYAFYQFRNMTSITIPESVTTIGSLAFYDCESMTQIALPSGLTEIGYYAFGQCTALKSAELPAGVTTLTENLFRECSTLSELTLHEGLVTVENHVFTGTALESIVFPASVEYIDELTFWGSNISAVYFSGNAPEIHDDAFYNVIHMDVYYPAGNTTWTEDKLVNYSATELTWIVWCPQGCSYETTVDEVTCTAPGGTHYDCPLCGDSYFEEDAPALGHDYVDGTCSRCGDAEFKLEAPTMEVSIIKASGKIKLSWNAVEGADGYRVYYSTDKGKTYNLLKKVSGTSLNHTSAKAGKTYYYYVAALDDAGIKSEASKTVNITCKLAQPAITVSNVASTGKNRITWNKISGAKRYEVYFSTDNGKNYTFLGSSNSTKLTHSSAKPGVKYRYKVMAYGLNSDGESAYSEYSAAKDRTCDLAQPKIKLSANSAGKNKISWSHIDGAVKYEVWRSTDGGKTFKKLSTTYNNYIINTSSKVGKTYHYKVKAIAEVSAANSTFSTVKSRTVERPGPVVSINLTTAGKPRLTWKAVSGATKYKVYCSTDGGSSFKLLKTTTNTNLTHTSAEAGTIYHYVVKAVIGEETRTSPVVFVPCVHFNISNSKSAKSVVNRINEFRKEYDIPTLKWYSTGLNAARVRATEIGEGYTRDDESKVELIETYNCYLELNFYFEGTAEELVDVIMYNYEDYASFFMFEGFEYAVAARNGDYWVFMFG